MTLFIYQARKDNKVFSGEIDARDKQMAIISVRQKGMIPINIEVSEKTNFRAKSNKRSLAFSLSRKIKNSDITFITRQLATLLNSGLPLSKALNFMAEQAKKPSLEEMVKSKEKKLQGGATLSDALSSYPQSFDALYLSMVRAGETGGILDKIMERLSMIRESREELAGKVKGALIYPAFMFFAMAGCIVVLMAFVVPKFALMFADMGQALPLPTLILMNISKVFQRGWWAIPIVAAFAVYGFRKYTSTPNGRLKVDMLKLNSPAVGEFLLGISMARFCRIVGTLIRSGVPLLTALKSAKDVTGNLLIQKGIELTLTEIQDGKKLGIAMGDAGVFPRYVCDMAVMGEESGTLDNMLLKVAENYERDADQHVKALTSLLEPLMILIMGGIVTFIVMAMLFPIFQMNLMAG